MGRIERMIFAALAMTIFFLMFVMFSLSSAGEGTGRTYSISILSRSPGSRFIKGIEQAALDYNVEIHIVSGYEEGNGYQQTVYLEREISNGVDAVVIHPDDEELMGNYLGVVRPPVPVVTTGARLGDSYQALHVGVNEADIGVALGKLFANEASDKLFILYPEYVKPYLAQRYEGLLGYLNAQGIVPNTLRYQPGDDMAVVLGEVGAGSTLLVLEESTTLLPTLCDILPMESALFGVGYAAGMRTHLESGRINALVVFSEYDAGYLSLQNAVKQIEKDDAQDVVLELYTADAAAMYQQPLIQILFPIG